MDGGSVTSLRGEVLPDVEAAGAFGVFGVGVTAATPASLGRLPMSDEEGGGFAAPGLGKVRVRVGWSNNGKGEG